MTTFGHPHLHLRATDSTNARARDLAEAGAPSGTIVTADEQHAGRGRRGRVWSAPPGKALLFSALLAPLEPDQALLPLAAPLAACEAIESVSPARCEIKWPNDVWIEERKVCGVLIEGRPPEWAVIGIGINVAIGHDEFPADLRWPAASIGGDASVASVRAALCAALGRWSAADPSAVVDAFRGRDALAGREVSWTTGLDAGGSAGNGDGTGVAGGVDERGNLVVETTAGERLALGAGEVTLRLAA